MILKNFFYRLTELSSALLSVTGVSITKQVCAEIFISCFRDFKVSSVINAGECIPTELLIFSTADGTCKYYAAKTFVFIS